jgi:hypothetical protein
VLHFLAEVVQTCQSLQLTKKERHGSKYTARCAHKGLQNFLVVVYDGSAAYPFKISNPYAVSLQFVT